MSVREKFDVELKTAQEELIVLSTMAVNALSKSMDALVTQDVDAALEVIEDDKDINQMEEFINDRVILLIAKQSPVATDLRRLIVTIKVASDMERVGDYAVNIAKETIRIGKQELLPQIGHIQQMQKLAVAMLRQVIDAFVEEDIVKAKEIAELDDQVDELYGDVIRRLMREGGEKPEKLSQITQLAFISRYMERSADHATNIAEQLFYLVRGQHYDLNK
ncbi:phosphate signaling complex protein PhoU [Microbacterium sp. APC 3898]|uniref:Phosphate-specific transport system accessory protein PhoU n=1 Tax=Planococcus notacanthi TaxID=3035188 RepID=A0ABT7ZI51_9BACL|nr:MULTISPECIES: phosphate signaling complex protein PhoU [Terrabacteria group]MBF6632843.1 phosphate signaling complex protein PhoU [Planococcus sp. (in: firmicutes)]MDN3426820.1 phosphate signaling complex protein PhoU [Planococcus sp. APC 4016]MDN3500330.1 phosphate signaling complex protein PhoU [Microbacterium sp. APC 3898]